MPHRTAALFDALGPWDPQQPVAIGFSGGADSVFLALAWKAYREQHPELAGIPTHLWVVDHQHHEDSGITAQAAAALAETLEVGGVEVLRAQDGAPPPPAGSNEQALRWVRYACFAEAAAEHGVEVLLLGHQADDQAETLLLRILRGTGMFGLAGIPARRLMERGNCHAVQGSALSMGHTEVRRPLLSLRRAELRERLRELGQVWLSDPSNADPGYAARNGVRLRALPMLAEWSTGDPVQALVRLQREADDWKRAEVEGVRELLHSSEWREAAGPQRRRAIELALRVEGFTTHPARVSDLEGALLRRGSANLDAQYRLTIAGGPLRLVPRRDATAEDIE
ncbi:MAG: tRNA lysidine(34) synthetase TilS [Planctomycetes bacterium]|nr:tRNA lysidine(34) synthetase TilS [Planctomycetota bacterium]